MSDEIVDIVPIQDAGVVLMPVMNIAAAKARLKEFQEFVREYLVEGEDYGIIPGTPKPTLLKPGADKLCELYGLADKYHVREVENWQVEPPLFDYTVTCTLVTRRDDRLVGSGMGSCNSWEAKFKYRESSRKCPFCSKESIIKGKEEYGGGWVCFKKKGGCGAKFLDEDKAITDQQTGKVINDDVATQKNTVLKMAKKRAKIDAVIAVTRSSGIFTQDMEDMQAPEDAQGTRLSAQRVANEKIAEFKSKTHKVEPPPDTLFFVYPAKHNGHFAEFINIAAYGAGLDDVAKEGLHQVVKRFASKITKGNTILVSQSKMQEFLEVLAGDCKITVKELQEGG